MSRYALMAAIVLSSAGLAPARELDERVARADAAAVAMIVRVEQGVYAVLDVEEVLKGDLDRGRIRARFEGINPFEMPPSGSRRVLLLVRAGDGGPMTVRAGDMLTATLANIEAVVLALERARPARELPVAETVPLPPRGDELPGPAAEDVTPARAPVSVPRVPVIPEPAPPIIPVVERDEAPPEIEPTAAPVVPSAPRVAEPRARTVTWAPSRRRAVDMSDLAARSDSAFAVLSGRVTSVEPPESGKRRAIISFEVEEALKGGFEGGESLRVAVPLAAEGRPSWRPRRGRAVIFVDVDGEGGLRLIHPLYGVETLDGQEKTAALYEKLGRVAGVSAATPVPERSGVGDCLEAWQRAWNAKDLVATVACYSARSAIAKGYRLGGVHRDALRRSLREFPDRLAVSVRRIGMSGRDRATVSVTLIQSRGEMRRRSDVEMLLVREGDAWRILREGF